MGVCLVFGAGCVRSDFLNQGFAWVGVVHGRWSNFGLCDQQSWEGDGVEFLRGYQDRGFGNLRGCFGYQVIWVDTDLR